MIVKAEPQVVRVPERTQSEATASAAPAIRVAGLRKRFRKQTRRPHGTLKSLLVERLRGHAPDDESFLQVLDGIDLEVAAGTTLGIIGRNGSGKSTLLKVIAGILHPDEGEVEVRGRVSPLIELGAGFHPEFSGRENVLLNGLVLGMSETEVRGRFDAIVDFAGLGDFIDDPVRTYSSGMYMRLAFSVAVHAEPDVLLIDEILAVGDEAFIAKCHERIAAFQAAGKTIVMVSHQLASIERWCHEAIWLDEGRVKGSGPPTAVVREYHAWVEGRPAPARGEAPDSRHPGVLKAELRLLDPPETTTERGRFRFRLLLEVCNRGDTVWRSVLPTRRGTILVGGRMYRDGELLGETQRAVFPRDVHPGEDVRVELKSALPGPGRYRLELDLVDEEICWFADRGSMPLRVEVET